MNRRIMKPGILLSALIGLAIFYTSCQAPDSTEDKVLISVEADSSYLDFERLWVGLIDSATGDTTVLFRDSLRSFAQLRRLPVSPRPVGPVRVVIRGFAPGDTARPVFEEYRVYDLGSKSLQSRTVPLDEKSGISRPPVIDFPEIDSGAKVGDTLRFRAKASDPDGNIIGYAWFFTGSPQPDVSGTADTQAMELAAPWVFLNAGFHEAMLEVRDNTGNSVGKTIVFTVGPNHRPSIRFTFRDTILSPGDTLAFAAGLVDSGAILRSYAWDLDGDGVFAQGLVLEPGLDSLRIERVYPDTGRFQAIVKVLDGDRKEWRDTVTIRVMLSGNAFLTRLMTPTGDLAPAFSRNLDTYSMVVPFAVANLEIRLSPEDPDASILVAGSPMKAGDSTVKVSLEVGVNPIPIQVVAQNGVFQKTYTLNVSRRRNDDAALKNLEVSPGKLEPAFSPDSLVYHLTLRPDQDSLTLTPTSRDEANAEIQIEGKTLRSGTSMRGLPVSVDLDTVDIVVLAHNDTTARTYQVRVRRLPSPDATLKALGISNGALSPAFASGVTEYSVTVSNGTAGMAFQPVVNHPASKVMLMGKTLVSGTFSDTLPLEVGDNAFRLKVVAQSGDTLEYRVGVRRRSAEANLKALRVNKGTLSPVFAAVVTSYADTVSDSTLTVTALAADARVQSITIKGKETASDSARTVVALSPEANSVSITVKAEDGNEKTYSLSVFYSITFSKAIGGADTEVGRCVRQTSDGGYIVTGSTQGPMSPIVIYLLRTDSRGNVLPGWPKTFSGIEALAGLSVQQASDGGFIITGTYSYSGSYQAVYLLRTDAQGNALSGWPKIFYSPNATP
jgi:hypothetical protein